jgi:hypothetical protein
MAALSIHIRQERICVDLPRRSCDLPELLTPETLIKKRSNPPFSSSSNIADVTFPMPRRTPIFVRHDRIALRSRENLA